MADAFYDNVPAVIQYMENDLKELFIKGFLLPAPVPAPAPAPVPVPDPYPVRLVLLSNTAAMSDLEQLDLSLFSDNTESPPEELINQLVQWLKE